MFRVLSRRWGGITLQRRVKVSFLSCPARNSLTVANYPFIGDSYREKLQSCYSTNAEDRKEEAGPSRERPRATAKQRPPTKERSIQRVYSKGLLVQSKSRRQAGVGCPDGSHVLAKRHLPL